MADSRSNLIEFVQAFDRLMPLDSGGGSNSQPNQLPKWMVKILDYTESAIEGFKDHAELRGFYARTSRGTTTASKTDMLSSNALRHSHVILYIPRQNLQTKLESHIYKPNPIDKITIVNIAEMKGVTCKLQEIEYAQCYIQQLEPIMDWLLVELKITKYSNTLFKYGTDGQLKGKDMAAMDYSLNPKVDVNIYSDKPDEDAADEDSTNSANADDAADSDDSNDAASDAAAEQEDDNADTADNADNANTDAADDASNKEDSGEDADAAAAAGGDSAAEEDPAVGAVRDLAAGDQDAVANAASALASGDVAGALSSAQSALGLSDDQMAAAQGVAGALASGDVAGALSSAEDAALEAAG
ncbi:MAG: hypothetical protein NT128_06775, partial [Proteobacteria bacterium]|nr:hypothetical protein [Pseudomonadota bacterium]